MGPVDPDRLARAGNPLWSQARACHQRAQERMPLDGLLDRLKKGLARQGARKTQLDRKRRGVLATVIRKVIPFEVRQMQRENHEAPLANVSGGPPMARLSERVERAFRYADKADRSGVRLHRSWPWRTCQTGRRTRTGNAANLTIDQLLDRNVTEHLELRTKCRIIMSASTENSSQPLIYFLSKLTSIDHILVK